MSGIEWVLLLFAAFVVAVVLVVVLLALVRSLQRPR